jgi:hypothetical protein
MKPLLISTALVGAVVATSLSVSSSSTAASQSQPAAPQPWQVGQCYRIFPADRDTLYTFKVLEPPVGGWVRVESAPSSPPTPGGLRQAPLWLNTTAAFAVQEWSCTL